MEIEMINFLIGIIGDCTDQRNLLYWFSTYEKMNADQLIDLMTVCQIAPIMKFGDFIMK